MSPDPTKPDRTYIMGLLSIAGLALVALLYVAVTQAFSTRTAPYRTAENTMLVGDVIQVSVRNGCGVTGLAENMTHFLRKKGFDVVEVGNLPAFDQEYSMVYDRIGDLESAKKLAVAVGLPEDRVAQDIDPEEYLDATIVIGKDYTTLTPFKTPERSASH